MRAPLVVLALLLGAPAAHADWQFAKWGMTPEQVVAASGGTVELVPLGKRPRIPPLETAASGESKVGPIELQTTFSFGTDGSGLACVFYGVYTNTDNAAFKTSLISQYGPPKSVSGLPAIGQENFRWTTATDDINASFTSDDPAYASNCRKK